MNEDLFLQIKQSLIDGDPTQTINLTQQAIERELGPLEIIDAGLVAGMNEVGEKYASGEYFIPHLTVAAKGMKEALKLLDPLLQAHQQSRQVRGKVVIGTVKGDIHEIGKSLVGTMLSANGFEVFDLGVDVSGEDFLSKVQEVEADFLGLSALLTTTMTMQREILQMLQEQGMRERVKVLVGGAPVSQEWAVQIGADGYAEDAVSAVNLAIKLKERVSDR